MIVIGKGKFIDFYRGKSKNNKNFTIVKVLSDDFVYNLFCDDENINLSKFNKFDDVSMAINLYPSNNGYKIGLKSIGLEDKNN